MQLGMVGLGRMGANLVRRLIHDGHECVVTDLDAAAVAALEDEGAMGAADLSALAAALSPPRAVWIMVPAAVTGSLVDQVAAELEPGDLIIDGGNSFWRDDIDRAAALAGSGIDFVDVGTSGGVFGLERGFSLMIGGPEAVVERMAPIFRSLAPGIDAAERTRGRTGAPSPAEEGWLHCGPAGAGHFVKMVHNGIEYGMMAALAEGLNVLEHADVGSKSRDTDAETAPLRDAGAFEYDLDVAEVLEVWRRGSVVASWLVDLTAAALHDDPRLDAFSGNVSDSGEGRWTLEAAIEQGVPMPVLASALFARFSSRGRSDFADRALSAMRREFGGHREKP
jgi:6-phosphogluconate dehydrogenase